MSREQEAIIELQGLSRTFNNYAKQIDDGRIDRAIQYIANGRNGDANEQIRILIQHFNFYASHLSVKYSTSIGEEDFGKTIPIPADEYRRNKKEADLLFGHVQKLRKVADLL